MNVDLTNDGEKLAFLSGLKQYLEDKGKILLPYPRLAGCAIDLHDLYNKVTALGGYQKVTEKELWEDLLRQYNFKKVSSTLCYGLKIIYQRFLEEYERVHYFGDDEGSKKPRFDVSIRVNRKPASYFADYERHKNNLHSTRNKTSRFSPNNYERLAFSLISCLPNEVDFAINACTLLSGESRHVLRLSHCPQVLEALLLHAGIVSDTETWITKTKHDLVKFWKNTVEDSEVLNEMLFTQGTMCNCENTIITLQKDSLVSTTSNSFRKCPSSVIKKSSLKDKSFKSGLFLSARAPGVQDYEGQRVLQIALVLLNLSFEEFNVYLLACSKPLIRFTFLCIHSSYSALRQTGLDILGNISSKMELFALGMNVLQCTFKTLEQCILSSDKFDKVRGLEILGNLCRSPPNKDCLITSISDSIYSSAVQLLTLGDIELMLAALDALYYLSKLGEESCTRIMLVSGCINTLVSLITINVRGLGSEHLAKIRIVKRILPTGNMSNDSQIAASQRHPRASVIVPGPGNHHTVANSHSASFSNSVHPYPQQKPFPSSHLPHQHPSTLSNPPQPAPVFRHPAPVITVPQQSAQLTARHIPSLSTTSVISQAHLPSTRTLPVKPPFTTVLTSLQDKVTRPQKQTSICKQPRETVKRIKDGTTATPLINKQSAVPMYTHTESQLVPPVFHYIPAPPSNIVLDKSPESFAQLWVWATYESCANDVTSTPRVEVFAEYATAATQYGMRGTKQVLPAAEFGRCLQQVFPNAASRLFKDEQGQPMYHITGIKKRQTPLPVPGHHLQPSITENQSTTSASSTSSDQNSVADSLTPQTSTSTIVPTTSSSHPGATSFPPRESNSIASEQSRTPATSSCVQIPQLNRSASIEAGNQRNHNAATDKDVKGNGDLRVGTTDLVKSPPTNSAADRRSDVTSHNHCTNHHSLLESESLSKDNSDGPVKSHDSTSLPDKLHNHCDAVGSELKENGQIDGDEKTSEKIATTEANSATSKIKSENSLTRQVDVTKHNGEVTEPEKSLSLKEEIKREVQTERVLVNGAVEEHSSIENCLNSEVKHVPLDEKCVSNNQQCPPRDDSSTSLNKNNDSQSTKISPQVSPITPHQLRKHYESQKNTTAEVISDTRIAKSESSLPGLKSNEMKRHLPSITSAGDVPPAKLQKLSEQFPTLPPDRLSFTAPPHNQPSKIVPNQTSVSPAPSTTPAAHRRSTVFPPHRIPPPMPTPQHVNQAKPPVIDLMAPNASFLVLMRNCGRFHFEDVTDEKEDPISKSIRLTAVLILINICRYSDEGRSLLQRHESWFAHLSMSRIDCSPMIAKLLAEIDR